MNILNGSIAVEDIANFAVALTFIISTFLVVIFIIKGGISFITSGGDNEKIQDAMHTIRYAIIGFMWIFISFILVKIIGILFDKNFLAFLTLDKIQEMYHIIMESFNSSPEAANNASELKGILD